MAKCSKEKEKLCLCKDCKVSNCERFNCFECDGKQPEKIHEVFFRNTFRKE